MAATVADGRKRGADAFLLADDDDGPFSLPQLQAKRGRCLPSAAEYLGVSLECDPLESLRLIFSKSDPEVLRGYFESSGNVLDAAVRAYKDYLKRGSETTSADAASSGVARTSDGPEPTSGAEWAELIFREMSSASDLIDAKNRVFRILELLNKSTSSCNTPDEEQKMREEHKILKQMLGGLLHHNSILKRAVLIQDNRYQGMVQERSQFKEIVDKYQQQIKKLEGEKYLLSVHLAQSNKHNSTWGHRNPDVF